MINLKLFQKRIAIVLLAIFLPSLLPFNLLYANNSGPIAPEAASFEPVDATDMVNLVTGDMSYVMPVLNVPSPEGGYPLALSYHAGIAMDQEASWVGLGWNLNPGAINRSVNGVPDDWYRVNTNQVLYNAGGEAKSYSGSISVGWGDKGAYSVGLYAAYSENKTFGGTTSYNFDGGVRGNVGPMGGSIGSNGVGMNMGPIAVDQSFKNGSSSVSLNYGANLHGSVGVAGASTGIGWNSSQGYSASVGQNSINFSGAKNSSNVISTSSQSYSGSIQIYAVNIGFGYSKTRYWNHQSQYTKSNGALYSGDMQSLADDPFPTHVGFDSYNSIHKIDADKQIEGDNLSYVSYDNYSVSGQGISGSFKPFIFEHGSLLNTHISSTENKSTVSYLNGGNSFTKRMDNNNLHFYFENDNSSFLKTTSGNWSTSNLSNVPVTNLSPQNQSLEYTLTIDGQTNLGYNTANKRKRTGSVIESFTNEQLLSNPQLVIQPNNISRSNYPIKGVGAFKITSMDGKTYHYSLPVYQKEKFSKNTDLDSEFDNSYLEIQQLEAYATHWLVTAITGPDYYDKNQNNKVDEGDYGYWVEFDYGKWSDGFAWSTPVKYMEDAKIYEWGVKEIYYLDKVKTRTHTAVFVKSDRQDDASYNLKVGNNQNNLFWQSSTARSFIKNKNGSWHVNGVFQNEYFQAMNTSPVFNFFPEISYGRYINFNRHKSLKLDKILLYKNEDLANLNIVKTTAASNSNFSGQIKLKDHIKLWYTNGALVGEREQEYNKSWTGEFYNNVYDRNDVSTAAASKAIKGIEFKYATSDLLARNSRNSSAVGAGRLTLKEVQFTGKNSAKLIPPYKFHYAKNLNYDSTKEDNWGYYSNNPDTWSLTKISAPTGADINVVYESDDIDKEAVSGFRGFDKKIQFVFSEFNNKLRILVQNEYLTSKINFLDHFQLGFTSLDLWASNKHDYNDWGCESRKGSVDINSEGVQVVAVTSNSVTLEFSMSAVYNDNGGFGWMSNKAIGLDNHPGMIRESFSRGAWGEPPGCTNVTDRLVLIYHLLGNKKNLLANEKNSGGIRVKELNLSENNIVKNRSRYFYNVPGFGENKADSNYKSSGVTSYVPQKYFKEIKYRTELPPPTVLYEYVTVKNFSQTGELGNIEQYNFNVLGSDLSNSEQALNIDGILSISKDQQSLVTGVTSNNETYNLNFHRYSIADRTSKLGSLKEKRSMNAIGQNLSIIKNEYENPAGESGRGIYGEVFRTYKKVKKDDDINYRLGIVSKVVYPNAIKSTSSTANGKTSSTYYDKYSFLTGEVLESRNITSEGKTIKSKSVPAYMKYQQMGSKVDNVSNRNMLSQTTANFSYMQEGSTWKMTGVGITTWNNAWSYQDEGGEISSPTTDKEKIWRKHKTYIWNGVKDANGFFAGFNESNDDAFVWGVGQPQTNAKWKQFSEVTLYNNFSIPLESRDVNDNKTAKKMDVLNQKTEVNGNAAYNEMYYSGAEIFSGGGFWVGQEVRNTNGTRTDVRAHTGRYSIATTSASQFGVFMRNGHRPGKYKISVWVHKDNYLKARLRWFDNTSTNTFSFNGEKVFAGDWVLLNHYTDTYFMDNAHAYWFVNSADTSTVYFDDLMIRPVSSSMNAYVYNDYDELTHIISSNGLATRFEYDAMGRLIKTYIEVVDDPANGVIGGFKLKSENKYHYKNL